MPIVKCKICKKEFYVKPNWIKRGWGKFCSNDCRHKSQLKGQMVHCEICGKEIWRRPKSLIHSKSGKTFVAKPIKLFGEIGYFLEKSIGIGKTEKM